MSNDDGGCIGTILGGLIIIAIVYFVIVYIIVPVLITIAGVGGAYGGVVSIRNYGRAFNKNIIRR